jgi:carboxylesterase
VTGESFELVGDGGAGAVCVHGFTGTPFEVRYLGEQIANAGFAAFGPRLPGHGTSLDDLDRTRWQDWADAVDLAVDRLRNAVGVAAHPGEAGACDRTRDALVRIGAQRPRIALVGQSLGGLLALHAASRRDDIACVASLATPLWLDGLAARAARWTRGPLSFIRRLPKLGGSDVRDKHVRAENPCYPAIPTRALGQLTDFMRVVDDALPRVRCPVLVLHARHDHTAPVACAARIAEATRAERVRILPRSYHLIAADVERDVVAAEVVAFLRRHATQHDAEARIPCAM